MEITMYLQQFANTEKHENNLQWYLSGKVLNLNNYLYDFKDIATNPKTQNVDGRDICPGALFFQLRKQLSLHQQ